MKTRGISFLRYRTLVFLVVYAHAHTNLPLYREYKFYSFPLLVFLSSSLCYAQHTSLSKSTRVFMRLCVRELRETVRSYTPLTADMMYSLQLK